MERFINIIGDRIIPEYSTTLKAIFSCLESSKFIFNESISPDNSHHDCRCLTHDEIALLQQNNNYAIDWSQVFVKGISDDILDFKNQIKTIVNCQFMGKIVISFPFIEVIDNGYLSLRSGLYNSSFMGSCFISPNVVVSNSTVANLVLSSLSSIHSCPLITSNRQSISIMKTIEVGPESGSRVVKVYPGIHYSDAVVQSYPLYKNNGVNLSNHSDLCSYNCTFIGENSHLINMSRVFNSIIGNHCRLSNSTVDSCILMNSVKLDGNAQVSEAIIHSGCTVVSNSFVRCCYLFENSCVYEYARLNQVILGPDASMAGGECHHSLVGPFTGFHHHSLLIATLWPFGRGNVAYGSKIGSNHSGRVNDQECWMGEGIFVGLDVSIKFPFNSIFSPYSMVATGTHLQSQKIDFPFSLITDSDHFKPIVFSAKSIHSEILTKVHRYLNKSDASDDCILINQSITDQFTNNLLIPSTNEMRLLVCDPNYSETSDKRFRTEVVSNVSSYNQVKPAWMLYDNSYYIERCSTKFSDRKQSKNHSTDHPLFRPFIIQTIEKVLSRLMSIYLFIHNSNNSMKTDNSIPEWHGIKVGQCLLTILDLERAIDSYIDCVHRFALSVFVNSMGSFRESEGITLSYILPTNYELLIKYSTCDLINDILDVTDYLNDVITNLGATENAPSNQAYQLQLIKMHNFVQFDNCLTFYITTKVDEDTVTVNISMSRDLFIDILNDFKRLEVENAKGVKISRDRDNMRGIEIIPDYHEVNSYAKQGFDKVIYAVNHRVDSIKMNS